MAAQGNRDIYNRRRDTVSSNTGGRRQEASKRNTVQRSNAAKRNNAARRSASGVGESRNYTQQRQSENRSYVQQRQSENRSYVQQRQSENRSHVQQRQSENRSYVQQRQSESRSYTQQRKRGAGEVRHARYAASRAEKKKKKSLIRRLRPWLIGAAVLLIAAGGGYFALEYTALGVMVESALLSTDMPDWIKVDLIPVDGTSRRGVKLETRVKDIVIHYVGNPGTSAAANRSWYVNSNSTVSSHFIVGLEGEIIQCVPLDEKSSASNNRNRDTISIETCHPDESGKFGTETYNSLVKLTAWLCKRYKLSTEHVIRHYDITGKDCPKYFVEHEDAWEQFKMDVANYYK